MLIIFTNSCHHHHRRNDNKEQERVTVSLYIAPQSLSLKLLKSIKPILVS